MSECIGESVGMGKLIVVLHDVSSQSKVNDLVKVVLAFKDVVEAVVVSKPSGAGAMYGVPEASKTLYKESVPLVVLPDIGDLAEMFPGRRRVFVSAERGRALDSLSDLGSPGDLALVLSANETGFSKKELEVADDVITLRKIKRELPPDSMLAVLLYSLKEPV